MLNLYAKVFDLFESLRDREEGQTLTEYALILALVSVVAVAALQALGTGILNTLTGIAGSL